MIQIITERESELKNIFKDDKSISVVSLSNYKSLEQYEINIIDLNCERLWRYTGSSISKLNKHDDLLPLRKLITSSNNNILILLPNNYNFKYSKAGTEYYESKEIKNITDIVIQLLKVYISSKIYQFDFDRCSTKINEYKYESDFYFPTIQESELLLKSDKGSRINTYRVNNYIITTLNVIDTNDEANVYNKFINFINSIYKNENDSNKPNWVNDIMFYNDKECFEAINKYKEEVKVLEEKIKTKEDLLNKNSKIKSILYTTDNELRNEVVIILEDILNEHVEFLDKHEEDYKFLSNDTTFIVEVKGVNGEVSGQNVNDAFSHLTIYEDTLEKNKKKEKTKCLFFVANERNKNINERKRIKERQETIAKRNNTLIIDTPTLLNIYEDFLNKKITKEEIINIFIEQYGLINYEKK